ncbi:ABC-three component system protein [Micromonospora sp. WMMD812]|uniref:ABC-three component system protein n=1 Tax=Micromonospora sp. WMMD812 TaxID=3015152 RepID=UPI00248AD9E3|nr:ABC-three component system protein [Micromonospora sp. WMMD812]WBB68318.1 hypothetical protein O7603_02750 [Micromonospora sp. WMMD812]
MARGQTVGTRRNYSLRTLKVLFALSGGCCAFPGCRMLLVDRRHDVNDPVNLTNIAHIRGAADDGPRADPTLSVTARNAYPNLMLLCPTHHKLVDDHPDRYPVEVLVAYKARLEKWVHDRLTAAMVRVTSAELDVVCRHLVQGRPMPSSALRAVPAEEKLRRNDLGDPSRLRLTIGMAQSPLVADYLQRMAAHVDHRFPGNLRRAFVSEYERLWDEGLRGDSLFVALSEFAGGEAGDLPRQAAGLAVLAHLFGLCDVFEEAA